MAEHYDVIIHGIRGDPPMNHVRDYKPIKDLIRGLMDDEQPGRTNLVGNDRAVAITSFDTWHKAFRAFNCLNGYPWHGGRLDAILQYPDLTTWLIHPSTDPTASIPLVRRYRTSSGSGYPFIAPQLARERRNTSKSSVSSQTSSQGSMSSISSAAMTPPFTVFGSYEQFTPVPVVIDSRSGAILPPEAAVRYLSASQADGSGRYQSYLMISNGGAQSPTQLSSRPRYEHTTEQRTVMIRELNRDVTEEKLQSLLEARGLASPTASDIKRPESRRCHAFVTFSTPAEAREAVRKLDNYRFMDRNLHVEIARASTTVGHQRAPSWQSPSQRNITRRPIIADGAV